MPVFRPAAGDASGAFALDANALAALKRDAHASPEKALRAAAAQFEAVFLQQLMKNMRASVPQEGPMDSDATRTYTEMLDAQLAQTLAKRGTGIADMLVKQLQPASAKGAAGAPATALPLPARGASATKSAAAASAATAASAAATAHASRAAAARAANADAGTRATTGADANGALPSAASAAGAARDVVGAVGRFVDKMKPYAEMAAQAMGVPANFLLAQAGLETGWGKSQPRHADGAPSHNFFGVKAGKNWKGAVVEAVTTEYVGGQPRQTVERFRAYASPSEAFADFAALLSKSGRYAAVVGNANPEGYATAMQRAGYATDPAYADKLARTIRAVDRRASPVPVSVTAQLSPARADKHPSTLS